MDGGKYEGIDGGIYEEVDGKKIEENVQEKVQEKVQGKDKEKGIQEGNHMKTNRTIKIKDTSQSNEPNSMNILKTSSLILNKKHDELEVIQKNNTEESGVLKELEASSKGKVKGSLLFNYFKSTKQPCMLVIMVSTFILAQVLASIADVWVSYWYVSRLKIRLKILFLFKIFF